MQNESARQNSVRPEIDRPKIETDDDRLKARIAEIRALQTSSYKMDGPFDVPMELIPQGWTWEWKHWATWNKEDPNYYSDMVRAGWTPVSASKLKEWLPLGYKGDTVINKGLILMERPTVFVQEARAKQMLDAREQVRNKEAQMAETPPGTAPRRNLQVSSQVGPVEIPG